MIDVEGWNGNEMLIRGGERSKGGAGCVLNIKCIIRLLSKMLLIYLQLRQPRWSEEI